MESLAGPNHELGARLVLQIVHQFKNAVSLEMAK